MRSRNEVRTGFTLVELLVVIAILSVLATAVIVILNPAELIKQARDSARISDLAAINSAIALFLSDVSSPGWSAVYRCTIATSCTCQFSGGSCTSNTSTTVDGNGWVVVNFNQISNGSPLSRIPLDPVNNTTYFYAYAHTTSSTYELNANMESTKYSTNGNSDVESNSEDGGNTGTWYEVGNDPGLDL